MKHQFLWLDLETTGFDPATGRILEWAVVLCEDGPDNDFAVVEQYSSPVHWDVDELVGLYDDVVLRMHTDSGLWHEVEQCDITLAESETALVEIVDDLLGAKPGSRAPAKIRLAGRLVHFDLAWLRVHMPELAKRLSHQGFDVSTLIAAADLWCPGWRLAYKPPAHRALPDVLSSIADTRLVRDALRGRR
jgi:oligoribonuclease (3'-5' exoribonuclease)